MTNIKFILTLILLYFGITFSCYSLSFSPSLSIIGSYTNTTNYHTISSGAFDINNRKINFGFQFTQKFYITNRYFIEIGIRYHQYKKIITAKNQVDLIYDNPPPFTWERRFEALSVPILIGREFIYNNQQSADIYVGFSPGILTTSYAKDLLQEGFVKNGQFIGFIDYDLWGSGNQTPSFFFPIIEIGGHYQPLKNYTRFKIGASVSMQLNKAGYTEQHASIKIPAQNIHLSYEASHQQKILDFNLSLSYIFGKKRQKINSSNINCPEHF